MIWTLVSYQIHSISKINEAYLAYLMYLVPEMVSFFMKTSSIETTIKEKPNNVRMN